MYLSEDLMFGLRPLSDQLIFHLSWSAYAQAGFLVASFPELLGGSGAPLAAKCFGSDTVFLIVEAILSPSCLAWSDDMLKYRTDSCQFTGFGAWVRDWWQSGCPDSVSSSCCQSVFPAGIQSSLKGSSSPCSPLFFCSTPFLSSCAMTTVLAVVQFPSVVGGSGVAACSKHGISPLHCCYFIWEGAGGSRETSKRVSKYLDPLVILRKIV